MTDPKHDELCKRCGHYMRHHGDSGHCYYPLPPYGQQCQTCNRNDEETE